MFETVATASVSRSRRLLYETLPVSIVLHLIAVGVAVGASLWKVEFPRQSPRFVTMYSLTAIPDPPPPPPPPPPPKPAQQQPPPATHEVALVARPQVPVEEIVAPTVIPDEIPLVSNSIAQLATTAIAVGGVATGIPGGEKDGQAGGEIGGKLHGITGGIQFPDDGRVHIERGKPLPLLALSQEYPSYPPEMKKKRIEDSVIVRYVIGTDGRMKDVQVIDPAKQAVFNEVTVSAIRRWRFRPMIKDGKPTEVVHELLVNFELVPGG
ncbi:MAG: TonB family protein [Acidobacteria bacterium]|nr:TonB family protein [Acidobacteriota bacterium]